MISPENPNQFAHHNPEQTSDIESDLTDNPARPYIETRANDIRLGDVPCPPEWREFIDSHKPEEQIDLARKLVQSSILENQKRVESVSQKPANTGMTVCIPLAIRYETPETIERLMQQIISASNGVENGVNVLIWANAKYKDHEEFSSVEQEVSMSYKELRQQLQRFEQESDAVTISTAMDKIVPDEQFSMSQIRNNYMEAITGRLIDGELEEDHPIVWLDADTTRIRPNTLSAIQRHVKKDPYKFYHPDINYSLEWLEGKRPEEWDVNSKLLFIDEMAQREHKRVAVEKGFPIFDRYYPDESGLSFSLYSFLKAGGIDTNDPLNESHSLLTRTGQRKSVKWIDEDKHDQVGIEVSARRTYQEMSSLPPGVNVVPYRTFSYDPNYVMSSDQSSGSADTDKVELDIKATTLYLLSKRRSRLKIYTEADKAARKVTKRMLANKVLNIGHVSKEE